MHAKISHPLYSLKTIFSGLTGKFLRFVIVPMSLLPVLGHIIFHSTLEIMGKEGAESSNDDEWKNCTFQCLNKISIGNCMFQCLNKISIGSYRLQ